MMMVVSALISLIFLLATLPGPLYAGQAAAQEPGLRLVDAVSITLSRQPEILIQKENVTVARGSFIQEKGSFDPDLSLTFSFTQTNTPLNEVEEKSYKEKKETVKTAETVLQVQKLMRNGITLTPSVTLTQEQEPFVLNFEPQSTSMSTVSFEISIPLLKGRGTRATAAQESAAAVNMESTRLQFQNQVSQNILNTVLAYWEYVLARENVRVWTELEKSARLLVGNTEELIKAMQEARASIYPVRANRAQRSASRIRAERFLADAREKLGVAMGLDAREILEMGLPQDPFPDPSVLPPLEGAIDYDHFIGEANKHRADLLSLAKQAQSQEILTYSAKNSLLPELDVSLQAGYSALANGGGTGNYFEALVHDPAGLNYMTGLTFQYPFGNHEAVGAMVQQRALWEQARLKTFNLRRKIGARIVRTLDDLRRSVGELRELREAVHNYSATLKDEKERLKMGMSTLNEIFVIEDRQEQSLLSLTQTQNELAANLANLLYESGTLIRAEGTRYTVETDRLVTIPAKFLGGVSE